ncbi:glycosyltransferase family 4 protein [Angustibacter aerolatus]
MKVAVVGPAHPFKGGVAAHTTELARHLALAGHDTELVSWSRLYPGLLYPGEQQVPHGTPDLPPYARTTRPLSWASPASWVRTGRRLRRERFDVVVVVHVVPAVVPAHLALLRAVGDGPRVVVVAHNVLPHEPHPGAAALVRSLLRTADDVLVHSREQADLARSLGGGSVHVLDLPPHLPGGAPLPRTRPRADEPGPRLLALGLVRPYKGTDLLAEAVLQVPGVRLTVAGEAWGEAGGQVHRAAADPRAGGRIVVRPGYVPSSALPALLADHDVLALPYRSATASQNALLGHAHGLPVLASRVGTFAQDVRDGVDGLLVVPGDPDDLVRAAGELVEPGVVERLRRGVRPPDLAARWHPYVAAVTGLAGSSGSTGSSDGPGGSPA